MTEILKFRVWDIKNNKYSPKSQFAILDNGKLIVTLGGYYEHFTNTNQDDYLVEYCTGYKDKDNNPLYVNDYVEFKLGLKMVKARIIYDHFAFWLHEIRGGVMSFYKYDYKLIGNNNIDKDFGMEKQPVNNN